MPTHVSIRRSHLLRKSSAEKRMILFDSSSCSRHYSNMGHSHHGGAYKVDIRFAARAKRWWTETTKLVKLLKSHLDNEQTSRSTAIAVTDESVLQKSDEAGAEDFGIPLLQDESSELLCRAMRTARLPPLQLERTLAAAPRLDQLSITKKKIKINANKRSTYPLATGRVEFQENRGVLSKCL